MKTRTIISWIFLLEILYHLQSCQKDENIEEELPPQSSTAILEIHVDERIELLSVVQHFTSWANKRHTKFDISYKDEIDSYFGAYANNEAIQLCQEMVDNGFTYDVPPAFILCHSSLPDLQQQADYPARVISRGGSESRLNQFAQALKDFAEESNFQEFFNTHQSFYQEIEENIVSNLGNHNYIEMIENYFGEYKSGYHLIAAPLFHAGGYSTTIESENSEFIYSIQGPIGSENNLPVYGEEDWFEYVTIHKFCHAIINPVTEINSYATNKYHDLYLPIEDAMKQMAYSNWITCVNEHLVRVSVARFSGVIRNEDVKNQILEEEYDKGFIYVYELDETMSVYENNRDKYPDFQDFYPQILNCFKDLDN